MWRLGRLLIVWLSKTPASTEGCQIGRIDLSHSCAVLFPRDRKKTQRSSALYKDLDILFLNFDAIPQRSPRNTRRRPFGEKDGSRSSALQAIHAATGGAALILGADKELGTIEVGKWADLVFLDADPVADIRNTRRIWNVMHNGQLIDRSAILKTIKPASV
jgi:hypothetical protein